MAPPRKLGEIGRHRADLADDPHRPDQCPRKSLATEFGEIAPGDNPKLRRQRLEKHRNDIGDKNDPEQVIIVFGAGLDVRREVSGVHIGDRRHDCWARKRQQRAEPAPLAGQHLASSEYGTVGQRHRLAE
jgi:hypothetical protein